MRELSRREFLADAVLAGAALCGLPAGASSAVPTARSRVISVKDASVMLREHEVSQSVVQSMLDRGVAKLGGASTATAAWKKLFSPTDVVGIKTNSGFGSGASTHPELIRAVIQGLRSAGVSEDNIIVWDSSTSALIRGGLTPNRTGPGVKYYGNDNENDWGPVVEQGVFKDRICKVLAETATAVVNLPVLKTHHRCGISCCLKNHFGSIDNPSKLHDNLCTPGVADVGAIPVIKKKTRLVVIDALRGQYEGGPGAKPNAQWSQCELLLGHDPLAADSIALDIVRKKRTELGLPPIDPAMLAWLKPAQERGVGICDLSKIEVVKA